MEFQVDDIQPPARQSAKGFKRPKRSQVACSDCRRRKVRCDVAVNGLPCTNCRLDDCRCVITSKRRRLSIPMHRTSLLNPGIEDTMAIDLPDIPSTISDQNSLPDCDLMGTTLSGCPAAPEPGGSQKSDDGTSESTLVSASSVQQENDQAKDGISDYHRNRDDRFNTGDSYMPNGLLGHAQPPTLHDWSGVMTYNHLPFSYYEFLEPVKLNSLKPQDVAFLESQKCLHLPSSDILDCFLRQYFLYVHPCLPLIDEAYFWKTYRRPQESTSRISLLVLQSMLFAAASYIPLDVAKRAGYASILNAREELFRRGKLLQNFGVDTDTMNIARASLLLTYETSSSEQLNNSTWLAVAIQHARAVNAHQYQHISTASQYKRSDLKRLWWCCIIRDRIIALGMRRSIHITSDLFDFTEKGLDVCDLKDEIDGSEVYDSATKSALAKILSSLCKLAATLTQLITITYPLDRHERPDADVDAELVKCGEARARLNSWRLNCMVALETRGKDVHPSVLLYSNIISLFYHSARIALCHHIAFLSNRKDSPTPEGDMARLEDCKPELNDAVSSITDKVKQLVMNGSASHLPISAVAYTLLPQLLAQLNLQLASTESERRRNERIVRFYFELNRLYNLRFDTGHITSCIQKLLRVFESIQNDPSVWAGEPPPQGTRPDPECSLVPAKTFSEIFKRRPAIYLQMSNILDFALSTGQPDLKLNLKPVEVDLDGFSPGPGSNRITRLAPTTWMPSLFPPLDPIAFNFFSGLSRSPTANGDSRPRSPLSLTNATGSGASTTSCPGGSDIRGLQDLATDMVPANSIAATDLDDKDRPAETVVENMFDWVLSDMALCSD